MPNCKDIVDINKLKKGWACAFSVAVVNATVNDAVVDRSMKSELSHMFVFVPAAVGMAAGTLTTLSASFNKSCMPDLVKDNSSSFAMVASALFAGAATFMFQQMQNIHFKDFFSAKYVSTASNAVMILAAIAFMPKVRASIAQGMSDCSAGCVALNNRMFTTAKGASSSTATATNAPDGENQSSGLGNPLLDEAGGADAEAGSTHSSTPSLGGGN